MHLNVSSAKWRPFSLDLNVLIWYLDTLGLCDSADSMMAAAQLFPPARPRGFVPIIGRGEQLLSAKQVFLSHSGGIAWPASEGFRQSGTL